MSQAKVDRYKEEKKNRKQIIKKEKRQWAMIQAGLGIFAVVLVAWAGVAVYQGVTAPAETTGELTTYTVNTGALDDYMAELTAE